MTPDPYQWLREKSDPRVIRHLEEENARTEAALASTRDLQATLYAEMIGRIAEDDCSAPARRGAWLYYTRTRKGLQYAIHCRRRDEPGAFEEVLLDGNAMAAGHDYFRLGVFSPSPDGQLLAYATDTEGDEVYTLRIKDLATGQDRPDILRGTATDVAWDAAGRTLFYTTLDATKRPHRVWRHALGTPQWEDELVFEEPDQRFNLHLRKTRSGAWLLVELASASTTEIWRWPAAEPGAPLELLYRRETDIEYSIAHHREWFYVLINDRGRNFRLVRAPAATPWREHWQELMPHSATLSLESLDGFRDFVVVSEREDGLRHLRILEPDGTSHRIPFPEPVYTVHGGANYEYDSASVRYEYTSLVTPPSVFDYDVRARSSTLCKQTTVHGYDATLYASERTFATAPDGTRVPMALVWRKDVPRTRTMLYGYGSYGLNSEPHFSSERLSLLDRGWLWAIAQVRGGGELGQPWHDAGKMLRKKNTFTDFIACAEHLIARGDTAPDRLAIMGRSAGGMLVGAVLNLRPDLFHAAIAGVPFVDCLNTMLDASLPLTVGEYEEWGNPNDPVYHDYIRSYAPYENVTGQAYPHLLVTAGLNDPRVAYWEPAKWVARLRERKTDTHTLLLKTEMGAGHFGPSGRYERYKETALEYAFLLTV